MSHREEAEDCLGTMAFQVLLCPLSAYFGVETDEGGLKVTLVFLGLFIILIILVVKNTIGKSNLFLKATIHILGGIVGLWLFNLVLSLVNIGFPINVFTIVIVGLLGFPGVLALVGLQLLGI